MSPIKMAESMRCCLGCGLGFFGPMNWAYVLGEGRDTFGEGATIVGSQILIGR